MKYLIVGLGNPGTEYEETRHNIGFKVVDAIAQSQEANFAPNRLGDVSTFRFKARTFVLLKPSTYMNLSGKAVRYWMDAEKIPVDHVFVVTDDLALPFGTLRIRGKGSDGGHNGLKDIQAVLNTTQYPRLRFGIGDAFNRGSQVDYVLGKWTVEERAALPERLDRCVESVWSFATAGLGRTMNAFNNT
jgi:peptidyl-tRNA hydrolase, PTH1 family